MLKNTIISLNESNWKVFGFNDNKILISSKNHNTFESLESALNKKGIIESFGFIPFKDLLKMSYNEKESSVRFYYIDKDKTKSSSFTFEDIKVRNEVVNEISLINKFIKKEEIEKKWKQILVNLIISLSIIICIFAARMMAEKYALGENYNPTGSKRGLKILIFRFFGFLGPTWATVLGILILIYSIYTGYQRYMKPAKIMIFEKG